MKIVYTDVLVIGGGLAGLRMAVAAKRRGHDSIVLSLVPPKRSHSKAAQGGRHPWLTSLRVLATTKTSTSPIPFVARTGVLTRTWFACS